MKKTVVRFLGRTDRHILFEFLVLIGLLSSVGIIAASQWSTTTIASRGNLRVDGVGVYNDLNCTVATAHLDWGTLEPGSASNVTVYVGNEGNHAATLVLMTNNWNPPKAPNYMNLNWTYNGKMLYPMEVLDLRLTLSVSEGVQNISGFSFDVIITLS